MLFPYVFVPHSMDKMQGYIDFIFYEVWSKAKDQEYDIDMLFSGCDDLKELITELHYNKWDGADFFLKGLQLVYEDFKTLDDSEINMLKLWYRSNNSIGLVCANDLQ